MNEHVTQYSSRSRGKYREIYYLSIHTDLFLKLHTFVSHYFLLISHKTKQSMNIMYLTWKLVQVSNSSCPQTLGSTHLLDKLERIFQLCGLWKYASWLFQIYFMRKLQLEFTIQQQDINRELSILYFEGCKLPYL